MQFLVVTINDCFISRSTNYVKASIVLIPLCEIDESLKKRNNKGYTNDVVLFS